MSDAAESTQSATKRRTGGKQASRAKQRTATSGTIALPIDDETAAALTLYNTYFAADREQQAHERAVKKAEKVKNEAAAAVRKLNDSKAPAAETAEAEATYREAVETLQRLRDGGSAPTSGDEGTPPQPADETSGDTADDTSAEAADETSGEIPDDTSAEAADETSGEAADDTSGETVDEVSSVGVEASVGDEDLAGDEPAGVAG
ncbi:MAG: hypothetical protein OXC00_13255 [Acidimicrobiaceae bacterium]|nr:hypothetical protein [Acidimicrobiaceae bacterium]